MLASSRCLVALSLLLGACANTVTVDAPDASTTPDVPAAPDAAAAPDVPLVFVDASRPTDRPPVVAADVPPLPVDAPPASRCGGSFILAEGARVSLAAIEPLDGGGFALAWVQAADNTTVVRVYDPDLTPIRPVGIPLQLPSRGAAPDALSLSFSGDTGAIAVGPSLHIIARSGGTLSLTNTLDLSPRVARVARTLSPSNFRVVTSDTALVFTSGARITVNTPNNPSIDPIGPGASVTLQDGGSSYAALEDVGGRLRMRRFISGHGSIIEVGDEAGDDASASAFVETPSALYRLVYRGVREVDVALEERDPMTLARRTPILPTLLHPGAAWNATTGALASTSAGELFMAWASRPSGGGYNSSIEAQWGERGAHATAYRGTTERNLRLFGAALNPTATRAWVIFGEPAAEGGYLLRGQCVAR